MQRTIYYGSFKVKMEFQLIPGGSPSKPRILILHHQILLQFELVNDKKRHGFLGSDIRLQASQPSIIAIFYKQELFS